MLHFVGQDAGQFFGAPGSGDEPGMYDHDASWQGEGVQRGIVHHMEFVGIARPGGEFATNLYDGLRGGAGIHQLEVAAHGLECLPP